MIDLSGPDEEVDLRNHFGKPAAISLGQASGDDKAAAASLLLQVGQREDGVERLLGGVADKGAGVDDNDLGPCRVRNDRVPRLLKDAENELRVDAVLRASQADETYRGLFSRIGFQWPFLPDERRGLYDTDAGWRGVGE